jgi:hypothetical protein
MAKVTAFEIKKALGKRHGDREFFITECKNGPTGVARGQLLLFDAIAIYKSWSRPQIRGYEIKVSRSDFLRDAKYTQYLPYCHEFYFVTPTGLVQRQEVEENIGLIWYNPKTGALTTKKKAVYRDIEINANMLLYIIMNRLDSDRLPFTSNKVEFWKDWLEGKKSNRELGYQVSSKLRKHIDDMEIEHRKHRHYKEDQEELVEIVQVMEKHGIRSYWKRAEALDEALKREYPAELDKIQSQLKVALDEIDKLKQKEEKNGTHDD